MESVLKTLKKKYGENNLIKILQDINPHLSTPQKKLNKKYITYTKFGSSPPGSPPGTPTPQTPPRSSPRDSPQTTPPRSSPRDSPHTTPRPSRRQPPQTPPSGNPLRRLISEQTQKSPYSSSSEDALPDPPEYHRQRLLPPIGPSVGPSVGPRIGPSVDPPVDLESITIKINNLSDNDRRRFFEDGICQLYENCLYELGEQMWSVFKNKKTNKEEVKKTLNKYSLILYMVANTKNLHDEIIKHLKSKWVKIQPELDPFDGDPGDLFELTSFGARTRTGGQRKSQRVRQKKAQANKKKKGYNSRELLTGRNKLNTLQLKKLIEEAVGEYTKTDGAAIRKGWKNTFKQNNMSTEHFNRTAKEKCRCALCGGEMFVFSSEWQMANCKHSTELEHQIPSSKAIDVYQDIFYRTQIIPSNDIGDVKDEDIEKWEKWFFQNIGGPYNDVENLFVYCCSLCNQVKSNMMPFTWEGNKYTVNNTCLKLFEEKLEYIFITTINGQKINLNGDTSVPDNKEQWKNCKIVNKHTCSHVWTIQQLLTFFYPRLRTEQFYKGSLTGYLRSFFNQPSGILQGQPSNLSLSGAWKDRNTQRGGGPGPYYGRGVNDNGETISDQAFQTLQQKYTFIANFLFKQISTLLQLDPPIPIPQGSFVPPPAYSLFPRPAWWRSIFGGG